VLGMTVVRGTPRGTRRWPSPLKGLQCAWQMPCGTKSRILTAREPQGHLHGGPFAPTTRVHILGSSITTFVIAKVPHYV